MVDIRKKAKKKRLARLRRHGRVRRKLSGTPAVPRLAVFRSKRHIYAQVIDDLNARTLIGIGTLAPDVRDKITSLRKEILEAKTAAENDSAEKKTKKKKKKGKGKSKKGFQPLNESPKTSNRYGAVIVGEALAERCRKLGITTVVFDRGGFKYHGRVKALADAARKSGLKF